LVRCPQGAFHWECTIYVRCRPWIGCFRLGQPLPQAVPAQGFKASGERIEGIPSQVIIQIGLTMVHSKVGMHPSARSASPIKTASSRSAKADPGSFALRA
jgi:hypothetical protein